MRILATTGVANVNAIVEKPIGSLVLGTDVPFEAFNTEKIEIIIDRNGKNNTNITPSLISLKKFVLATSYGSDAITSQHASIGQEFETVVIMELAEGGAIHLEGNDKIKINLAGLDPTKNYVLHGIEEPNDVLVPFTYEEKQILQTTKSLSIKTSDFDMCILEDSNSITSVDYRYANGRMCSYDRFELRAMSQDIDPIAYVKKNGTVRSGFPGVIQLPLLLVDEITIRKDDTAEVSMLFRVDLTDDSEIG